MGSLTGSSRSNRRQSLGDGGTSRGSSGPTLSSGGDGRGGGGGQNITGGGGGSNYTTGNYQAPPPGDDSATSWMEQQAQAQAGQQNQYFNPYGPQGPAGTHTEAGVTREMTAEEYADAKRASAAQAQAEGLSKAEWMNRMYGTDFFKNTYGQGAQETWGDDWYI